MVGWVEGNSVVEALFITFQNNYVQSIAIFLFFLGVAKIVFMILNYWVVHISKMAAREIDAHLMKRTEVAFCYMIVLFGFKLSLVSLDLSDNLFHKIINIVIIFLLAYVSIAIVDIVIILWSHKWAKSHKSLHEDVVPLYHNSSRIIIFSVAFFAILQTWNVQIMPIIAGLGIVGIIVGFAMKDSFANIFGGVSLMLDKDFKLNDMIKLDSGDYGKVVDIGLRSTKLRTYEGDILIIPNGVLANVKITNCAQPNFAKKVICEVPVAYGSDPDKIEKLLLDSLKGIKGIHAEINPKVKFEKMSELGLHFELVFFVEHFEYKVTVKTKVMKAIYQHMRKNKIILPIPARNVYMRKMR